MVLAVVFAVACVRPVLMVSGVVASTPVSVIILPMVWPLMRFTVTFAPSSVPSQKVAVSW